MSRYLISRKKPRIHGIKIPKLKKSRIPGIKIPRLKKSRIQGIYRWSAKRKNQKFLLTFSKVFQIPGISRKNKSRSPRFWDFRDFSLGVFTGFSNPDPDFRDFGIFGIFRYSSKLKISISKKSHPEANSL